MSKEEIFNKRKMTRLLRRYVTIAQRASRRPRDKELQARQLEKRNKIIELSLPLIEAALSKLRVYDSGNKRIRDDIRQECIVKLITALPKFDAERGNAFAFTWTTVCNMIKTMQERMGRQSFSLSSDETVQKEAEANGKSVFQSPENQHILNSVSQDLIAVLEASQVKSNKHKRACRYLQKSIVSGELFFDKPVVVRRLRGIGLERKDIQYYVQSSLVAVRQKLLDAHENAQAITHYNYAEPQSAAVLEDL